MNSQTERIYLEAKGGRGDEGRGMGFCRIDINGKMSSGISISVTYDHQGPGIVFTPVILLLLAKREDDGGEVERMKNIGIVEECTGQ